MIDYDQASKSYDNTRNASEQLIALFEQVVHFTSATAVLDFGCGTGNYLNLIQTAYSSKCYGIEPSAGMRAKVIEKNPTLIVEEGDHSKIPYPPAYFDFVYMTDVVHHVPDLAQMFRTIKDALKLDGKLCVVTESHEQIKGRFYNRYFPSLAENEMRRYPDIQKIVSAALEAGLGMSALKIRSAPSSTVSASLLKTVEEKNYSMFRLLELDEYAAGLERLRHDLGAVHESQGAGDSLIWLERG